MRNTQVVTEEIVNWVIENGSQHTVREMSNILGIPESNVRWVCNNNEVDYKSWTGRKKVNDSEFFDVREYENWVM